jgi:hypothetical protein
MMTLYEPLTRQAQLAYQAALRSHCPDWRSVAELFRAALGPNAKRAPKRSNVPKAQDDIPDYGVDRFRLKCRSPRIAVRFMDGEAVFTHVPSAPTKPLNIGRALRVAIAMYRSRRSVQQRLGFQEYDRAMPIPEIFQVRCLETDELFDVDACNKHTLEERASNDPERASAMLGARKAAQSKLGEGQAVPAVLAEGARVVQISRARRARLTPDFSAGWSSRPR